MIAAGFMSEASPPLAPSGAEPAVMAAAALLFFVYLGFEEVARHPARDLPLALFVSMGHRKCLAARQKSSERDRAFCHR